MGNHHDSLPELRTGALDKPQHLGTGLAVKVAGRFVGQHDSRFGNQGAGNRHTLLLAAGKGSRHLGPCPGLSDYPNLWDYARDLYQVPAFRRHTHFQEFAARQDSDRRGQNFRFHPYYDMVVPGTDFPKLWSVPAAREKLSSDPSHRFMIK